MESMETRPDVYVGSGVVSGVVTLDIVAFMGGNIGDGRVVCDMTCSKGEGLVESDGKGEGGSVEALGANRADNVDGINMVLSVCIDHRGC